MTLEEKQKEWDSIVSGERHCWNYIDTAEPDEDTSSIMDRLSTYDGRKRQILRDFKVCQCGTLAKKVAWVCLECSHDFRSDVPKKQPS